MNKIVLYDHNKEAYEKVKIYIEKFGKACVVHPTGTGKSYIGFALIEDNPDKKFLWLSPSEYIYKTQTAYLKKEQGIEFSNVVFYTFAWVVMNIDFFDEIEFDYIIIDEFHRAGGKQWGKSLRTLIKKYPNIKLLGLTATNIRYLDNRRDMALELFDGNIASYMSLEEAMAKRILPLPKYIISSYKYKNQLLKYEGKIKSQKNEIKKVKMMEILYKLKNQLDNAEGLELLFNKHIKNKTGKYIVFCANISHMYKMMTQVPLWFCYIDRRPHIYHVYARYKDTEKELEQFLCDNSNHLKLLFAVDMINEGIHIESVDGVILLRQTVSPIIYKQQIGRALATGKKGTPLIFDLVNNFDNLYIEMIKNDVYDISLKMGMNNDDWFDGFEIIDELKDCRKLIEMIFRNIDGTWDDYYNALCNYYHTFGNAYVPYRYIDPNKLKLGYWMKRQREIYIAGKMLADKIDKFQRLGIEWSEWQNREDHFMEYYDLLIKYKKEYGNTLVPRKYITPNGKTLGKWCSTLRTRYSKKSLSKDKIDMLNEIGFIWEVRNKFWEIGYQHALEYYKKYGNINVKCYYICEDGYHLGVWIQRQRYLRNGIARGTLDDIRINALDQLGMSWEVHFRRERGD